MPKRMRADLEILQVGTRRRHLDVPLVAFQRQRRKQRFPRSRLAVQNFEQRCEGTLLAADEASEDGVVERSLLGCTTVRATSSLHTRVWMLVKHDRVVREFVPLRQHHAVPCQA